jgi:dUTP pyrophosphatase
MALIGNLFTYFFCGTGIYYIYKILQEFNSKKLYVKLNDKNAKLPRVGSKYAAGYDLYSCDEGIIKSNCMGKINIGISLIIPSDHYGRIAPRSGLTLNYSLNVGAGVIDSDYRGNISVLLFNHGDKDFKYNIGDRVSQLIIEKISHCEILNVTDIDETDRGDGGFGSTGISNNNNIDIKYNDKKTVEEESDDTEKTVEEESDDTEESDDEKSDDTEKSVKEDSDDEKDSCHDEDEYTETAEKLHYEKEDIADDEQTIDNSGETLDTEDECQQQGNDENEQENEDDEQENEQENEQDDEEEDDEYIQLN